MVIPYMGINIHTSAMDTIKIDHKVMHGKPLS
jgi:hypothetical protein